MTKSLYDAWSGWLVVTLTGLASGKEDCPCSAALVSRTINSSPLLPAGFFFFYPRNFLIFRSICFVSFLQKNILKCKSGRWESQSSGLGSVTLSVQFDLCHSLSLSVKYLVCTRWSVKCISVSIS